MRMDKRIAMCTDICADKCMDMRVYMCVDKCIDWCVASVPVYRHVRTDTCIEIRIEMDIHMRIDMDVVSAVASGQLVAPWD